jgi:hypothetical protein
MQGNSYILTRIEGLFILIRTGVSEEHSAGFTRARCSFGASIRLFARLIIIKQGLDFIDSIKSSKMPRTRSSASLAASKATGKQARRRGRRTHLDIAEKWKGR